MSPADADVSNRLLPTGASTRDTVVRRAFALVAAVTLCHVPFWLMGQQALMPQPVLCIDVLLALAVFAWNRPLGVMAMLLAWALSLLRGVALNYHFHDVPEFLNSFRFAHLLSYSSFVTATSLLLTLGGVAGLTLIFGLLRRLRPSIAGTMVLLGLLGVADIANGSANAIGLGRDKAWALVNILGSPGYNLVFTEFVFLRFGAQPLTPLDPPPRSWVQLSEQARVGRGGAVLILAESLGWPRDDEIRRWLFSQLETTALRGGWEMDVASETFFGGTVGGEVRVLCGLRGHYSRLDPSNNAGCLPRVFRAQGAGATAMHGFSSRMFDRGQWWPSIGFDRLDFDSTWTAHGDRRCPGAFDGICDHDVLASALARAMQGRQFVYALTINTHLPLPRVDVGVSLQALCTRRNIPDAACQLLEAQGCLLRDIGGQVAALDGGVDVVMVVGDHSPPFHAVADREVFSASVVPSLQLRPHRSPE